MKNVTEMAGKQMVLAGRVLVYMNSKEPMALAQIHLDASGCGREDTFQRMEGVQVVLEGRGVRE